MSLIFNICIFIIILIRLPILFNLRKSWELISSLPHYMAFAPTYVHLLIIYAFCRIDDLSWGTKGLEANDDERMKKIK